MGASLAPINYKEKNMRNLFTHKILPDDDMTYVPYENPYLVSRVSPEVEAMMNADDDEDAKPKLRDDEKDALKTKEKKYLLGVFFSFAISLGIFMLISRIKALENSPLIFLPMVGMVIALVFVYKMKHLQLKRNGTAIDSFKDIDIEAMAARIDEASKAARAEMGIPDDDVSVEILPYGYKMKGDKQIPDKKAGKFDNTPMSMHRKDGKLCVFDGVGLYEIPLSDIKGYRTYNEDYRIEFWMKEEEPTDEKYKNFNLKKCGILEYKTHTYHGVEVVSEATGETFEMLVPGYDLEELKKVIDVETLA